MPDDLLGDDARRALLEELEQQADVHPVDRKLTAAEKRRLALQLRIRGIAYDEIARLVGWKSKASAHEAVTRALAMVESPIVHELRKLELERLDKAMAALMQTVLQGDPASVRALLKVMQQRARYVPELVEPEQMMIASNPDAPALVVQMVMPEAEQVAPVAEDDLAALDDRP